MPSDPVREVQCFNCRGTGKEFHDSLQRTEKCEECDGSGKVTYMAIVGGKRLTGYSGSLQRDQDVIDKKVHDGELPISMGSPIVRLEEAMRQIAAMEAELTRLRAEAGERDSNTCSISVHVCKYKEGHQTSYWVMARNVLGEEHCLYRTHKREHADLECGVWEVFFAANAARKESQ